MCIAILSAFCHSLFSTSGIVCPVVVRRCVTRKNRSRSRRVLVAKELLLLLLLWEQREEKVSITGFLDPGVDVVCVGITGCAADADAQDFDSLTLLPGNAFYAFSASLWPHVLCSCSSSARPASPPAYLSLAPCVSVSTIAVRTRTESG